MSNYRLDVNYKYQKIKSKMLRHSLLFSLVLAVVIVSDVLLVILAKEDYLINLIIACIITVLFSYFATFYFTNIYNEVNAQYRYYKGYASGIQSSDEVIFVKQGQELAYVNGLYVYPVSVIYVTNLDKQNKIIYSMEKDLEYVEGDKLTIETYQRILLKAEKHQ